MIAVILAALIQQANYHNTASRNAANYAEAARDHIGQSCAPLAPRAERECAQIVNNTARQNQREEYDLYSQKAMALWTAVMGGMAIVGVGLSVIGVYLIWQTFKETQRAANTALDTNKAYVGAERGVLQIYDINVRQWERPEMIYPSCPVSIMLSNYGRANCRVTALNLAITDKPVWPESFQPQDASTVIEPSVNEEAARRYVRGSAETTAAHCFFYIAGYVIYETMMLEPSRTHFFRAVSAARKRDGTIDTSVNFEIHYCWCEGLPKDT